MPLQYKTPDVEIAQLSCAPAVIEANFTTFTVALADFPPTAAVKIAWPPSFATNEFVPTMPITALSLDVSVAAAAVTSAPDESRAVIFGLISATDDNVIDVKGSDTEAMVGWAGVPEPPAGSGLVESDPLQAAMVNTKEPIVKEHRKR